MDYQDSPGYLVTKIQSQVRIQVVILLRCWYLEEVAFNVWLLDKFVMVRLNRSLGIKVNGWPGINQVRIVVGNPDSYEPGCRCSFVILSSQNFDLTKLCF